MQIFIIIYFAGIAFALPQKTVPGNSTTTACDAATAAKVSQLSKGIQSNLDIQKQELQGVQTLQSLDMVNGTMSRDFTSQRLSLLKIQQSGVDIRNSNQILAAELKSPSQQGLATVADAQILEINQVKQLRGGGSEDQATLKMLVQEVQDGTKQNMMNLAAAQSQCGK